MSRLIIFLYLYLCIYGAAHLYLLVKIKQAFYLNGITFAAVVIGLSFFLLAPIISRGMESHGHMRLAEALAWLGFVWMGFVFINVCLTLPLDGYHLLLRVGQRMSGNDWSAIMLSKQQSIGLTALIACCAMVYGAFESYHIRVEKITLRSPKIPEAVQRMRIVQISDVHFGPMFYRGRLTPLMAAIQKAKPDILVSTGDLIDGYYADAAGAVTAFNHLAPPLGKFAVTGNHEYYSDLHYASNFTQKAGFRVLHNQSVTIANGIVITGVDDPAAGRPDGHHREAQLLGQVPTGSFSLLLKHRPEIDPECQEKIDLQLSGHTHKGQIFPFRWMVRINYSLGHGLLQFSPGRHIYISRGTGTWGPPVRVLAPPEITIIDLLPENRTTAAR